MHRPPRRRKGNYFPRVPGTPPPLETRIERRVSFSESDPMGILWHGRYAAYFEQANEALGRVCGMSYQDFIRERLRAPIVQFHVDYFASPMLAEEVTVVGRFVWSEGARMNIEYEIRKEDNRLAATGFTVQMLVGADGETWLVAPPLLERCRQRWRNGEFAEPT